MRPEAAVSRPAGLPQANFRGRSRVSGPERRSEQQAWWIVGHVALWRVVLPKVDQLAPEEMQRQVRRAVKSAPGRGLGTSHGLGKARFRR